MIETSGPILYERLRSGGYTLVEPWWCRTKLLNQAAQVDNVTLATDGLLTIDAGWPWDGPSGPTVDTPSFMRGSLAHDALYALLRAGKLHPSRRKEADDLIYDLCRQDGMGWLRAHYMYAGLRLGAGYAAKQQAEPETVRLTAP